MPSVSGCGLGPVGRRVEVGAARQHEPVDAIQQFVGILDEHRIGRQQQRHRAGAVDRVDVAAREHERVDVPDAEAHALERRADADHRTGHAVHGTHDGRRSQAEKL